MLDLDAESSAGAPPSPATQRVLEIRFTGSGSEYFRIWAVNLLLILVTLGLYLPFAKARRIRYFYANTVIDGHALSFYGDSWKMFRGFLLLVVMMGVYSGAGHFAPAAAFPAFLLLCAVWPALWRSSLQFRLGNTAWRGLRARFDGTLRDAYLACAPVYLPTIAFIAITTVLQPQAPERGQPLGAAMIWSAVALSGISLFAPWSAALFKRYQHNGYRIAGQHGRVELPTGRIYALGFKAVLMGLLPLLVTGALVSLAVWGIRHGVQGPAAAVLAPIVLSLGILLVYLLTFAVVLPYCATRMQNLAWNGTRSEALAFMSRLRFRDMFRLTLKNWLLTALTLGLYRPFAAVSMARLRLQAVSIGTGEDPADWVAPAGAAHADATGDVAGDFFGIDMGL